jgi:hypothetical protein
MKPQCGVKEIAKAHRDLRSRTGAAGREAITGMVPGPVAEARCAGRPDERAGRPGAVAADMHLPISGCDRVIARPGRVTPSSA